jgi:hypothetical protein
MLNFVENLLENERGPMNDQDLTKTDYDPDRSLVLTPDRGSLSFSNKFSTKFSIVSNKLYVLHEWCVHNLLFKAYYEVKFIKTPDINNAKSEVRFKQLIRDL